MSKIYHSAVIGETQVLQARAKADIEAEAAAEKHRREEAEKRAAQAEAERKAAFRDGYAEGERTTSRRLDTVTRALRAGLEQLQYRRDALARELIPQSVELAMLIARKVVDGEVRASSVAVHRAVTAALAMVKDQETATVRLNPEDLEVLKTTREWGHLCYGAGRTEGAQTSRMPERVRFVADDGLGRGGCLVETPSASVDMRTKTRFEQVAEALYNEIYGGYADKAEAEAEADA